MLPPFITFYPAIMVIALYFGLWTGLMATALAVILIDFLIFRPVQHIGIASTSDTVALAIFFGICVLVCYLADRYRKYQRQIAALGPKRALEETRIKLYAALASTTEAVFISDAAGNFIDFNEAFATFHKFRDKAECALNLAEYPALFDVFLPSGEPVPLEMWVVSRALRGESAPNAEYRLRRNDTGETWVGCYSYSPIRDTSGAIVGSVVSARDITAQKRAEAALRSSEVRYRTAFELSEDAIALTRLSDGKNIDANQTFVDMSGYRRDEIVGRTSAELNLFAHPEDLDHFVELLKLQPTFRDVEVELFTKDGRTLWGVLSASLVEIEGELCALSFMRNITAFKKVQDSLRASEARYRIAFQTSLDAIAITRISDGTYLDVNAAFSEMAGYQREELIGHTSAALGIWCDPTDRERLFSVLRENRNCHELQAKFRKKSGDVIWGVVSASPIEIDGIPCILSIFHDITELRKALEAIASSEARYRTAFQTSLDAIAITRLSDGTYLDLNAALSEMAGYEREELLGKSSAQLSIWADPADRENFFSALREGRSWHEFQTRFRRNSGEVFWSLISASAVEIDGEPCCLSVVRDITELKIAQEAITASEARYRTAFQTSLDAITIVKLSDLTFVNVNQKFLEITGFDHGEVLGRTSAELGFWKENGERDGVLDLLRRGSGYRDLQARFTRKNGEVFWGVISASPMELEGETFVLSVVRDISEAKLAEEKIRTLAFFDPLTGLANRRLLLEQLRKSMAMSARSHRKRALLMVDLDDFRTLNDSLGHETGDLLLREVAQRMTGCVREIDTVSRHGGDSFVILLELLDETDEGAADQAKVIAEKILASLDQPYILQVRECVSTCSIGITVFGDSHENINEVLKQADLAMYQAKAAGRNTLRFFAPELQAAVNNRASMEEDLRQGIKSRQFELYYQPQVERGRLIGAEALVRWNHPRLGILLPGKFIPAAENTRLILPLGNWVLETACRQIAAWAGDEKTAGIVVAVNMSALQLRQPNFVDSVLGVLERTGANPRNLKLELTESMLVDDVEDVIAKMIGLKAHGLKFSVDDFGTGYSSLAYLKRLPLDQLKIDRSFVRDILVDVGSAAIAQTVISLSKTMGLSVIAEGVETVEQWHLLAELGCHSYQGYLFGRPLPVAEFEELLPGFTGTGD